jgi:hypothetical protein
VQQRRRKEVAKIAFAHHPPLLTVDAMDEQLAKIVIAAGFGVGVLFGPAAIMMYRRLAAAENPRRFESLVKGRQPVETLDALLQQGQLFSPQARLERTAENRLTVTQAGTALDLEATRQGADTRLTATVDDSKLTHWFQMGLGAWTLIVMPIIIGGITAALWHFVPASKEDGVRWQAVQIVQIVHVLWPPFLIFFIWRRLHVQAGNAAANLTTFAQAIVRRGGENFSRLLGYANCVRRINSCATAHFFQ